MGTGVTEFSQRDEAFWVGVAPLLLVLIVPDSASVGGVDVQFALVLAGGAILSFRVLVAVVRLVRTTAETRAAGGRERRRNDG